jgi:hypothetical protein
MEYFVSDKRSIHNLRKENKLISLGLSSVKFSKVKTQK